MSLRYSIYKVQLLAALTDSLLILSRAFPFVKNFFQVLSNFFSHFLFSQVRADNFAILAYLPFFVKDYFTKFRQFFVWYKQEKGAFEKAPSHYHFIIRYRRSGRSRLRCVGRQPRRIRRCPHPGRQRSYGPADSSASPLLPGS